MKSVAIGTVTNISGVGDDAYYSTLKTRNTTDTTLNVKKGVAAVVIRVSGGQKPVEEYQAKEKRRRSGDSSQSCEARCARQFATLCNC